MPLTLWLIAQLVALGDTNRAAFTGWLGRPLPTFLMILTLIATFRRAALGLQAVIEEDVHSALKIPLPIAMHFACFTIGVAGVLATLRIALARWRQGLFCQGGLPQPADRRLRGAAQRQVG